MRFNRDDDRVFSAFLAQRPAEGRKFSTDGRRLDGGMYLSNVASWERANGREVVVLHDLGSRTAEQIHRRLRKLGGAGIVKYEWELTRGVGEAPRARAPGFEQIPLELDLNVASPEQVAPVLRYAAYQYYEAASELEAAWQDPGAGRPWVKLGRILERAADQAERI